MSLGQSLLDRIVEFTQGLASIGERKARTAKLLREEVLPGTALACELLRDQFAVLAEIRPHLDPDAVNLDALRPTVVALRDELDKYLAKIEQSERMLAELAAPAPAPSTTEVGKKIVLN